MEHPLESLSYTSERSCRMVLPGLKKHRILAGLTQEELAQRAGMSRGSIVELEKGLRPARPRTLKKLAEAIGVNTIDLVQNGR